MKKTFLTLLLFCYFLPAFSHGDDIGFKAKFEKIPVEKVDIKGTGVETREVKEETVDDVVRTTGQIEELPSSHFDVNSPVQGKVISIPVDLGTMVSEGQVLTIIQSTEIAKLQSELAQSEAELELAKNRFDREQKLFEKGIGYVGTSAGAYIMCPNIKVSTLGPNPKPRYGLEDLTGLDYVPFCLKVHYTDEMEANVKEMIKNN